MRDLILSAVAAAISLVPLGCSEPNQYVEPPPAQVTIAQPLEQEVVDYLEFTGTTVSSAKVQVRARVGGVLEQMHFRPGSIVQEGDLLFTIDPREYEADLKSAEAELASARASFKRAEIELTRAQKRCERQAGGDGEVVKWRGEMQQAQAAIMTAEARIARAKLNLGYTRVQAPIAGRVGRDQINVGNLVGEGEATILTDITAQDPMFVYFNLNERDLLRVMAMERSKPNPGRSDDPGSSNLSVFMALANSEDFPFKGRVDFAESGVDPETGTLQLRGVFPNPGEDPELLPGLFTRVRLPVAKRSNMPLVSERALGSDQSGRFLMLVNDAGIVEKRNVVEGQRIDGLRVIEDGLVGDEWVVVRGVQRARPGAKVDAERSEMTEFTASALSAAARKGQASPDSADL